MDRKRTGIIILCIVVLIAGAFFVYFADYYHGTEVAASSLKSDGDVNVSRIDEGYYFDGPGEDAAMIFYPGAKVESMAYGNLMRTIAENGVDCFLVEMPFNFAFFGSDKADSIVDSYNYSRWAMSGHSLGGIVAAAYAADNNDRIGYMVLLASYPNVKIDDDTKMLSIYGDRDGVLNMESYEDARKFWNGNSTEEIIIGANHGGFGDYGLQKGDNNATISALEQQNRTAMLIVDFLDG